MSRLEPPTTTDPVDDPRCRQGIWQRVAARFIRDPRDTPFITLSLLLTAIFVPVTLYLFLAPELRWWMVALYWVPYGYFLGPFILMLHNTSHRVLFKPRIRWLNHYIPWVIGPLLGQSPGTYFAHHLGMHHAEGNLPADLSSTMAYQRDRFVDFLKYYGRFLVGYGGLVRYFSRAGRPKMLWKLLLGETAQLTLVVLLTLWNWQASLVVFILPFFFTRFMLMSGNWAQHAFVDPDEPTNDYRTVTTFINSPYNHRCFNDGYHLGHHLKPSRHWLEMPADFLAKRERMVQEGSLVFEGIDYFVIFWLLMFKRYGTLARAVVTLDPGQAPSEAETVALLRRRLRRFSPEQQARIGEQSAGDSSAASTATAASLS
ncbi:MAG: fatty acid desaturase [Deltaproteobacteria bacterium]|nr:fatty acid desaturase [Deltaproteobacteria bacterium]